MHGSGASILNLLRPIQALQGLKRSELFLTGSGNFADQAARRQSSVAAPAVQVDVRPQPGKLEARRSPAISQKSLHCPC